MACDVCVSVCVCVIECKCLSHSRMIEEWFTLCHPIENSTLTTLHLRECNGSDGCIYSIYIYGLNISFLAVVLHEEEWSKCQFEEKNLIRR